MNSWALFLLLLFSNSAIAVQSVISSSKSSCPENYIFFEDVCVHKSLLTDVEALVDAVLTYKDPNYVERKRQFEDLKAPERAEIAEQSKVDDRVVPLPRSGYIFSRNGKHVACTGLYSSYKHSHDGSTVCAGGQYASYQHSIDGSDVACGGGQRKALYRASPGALRATYGRVLASHSNCTGKSGLWDSRGCGFVQWLSTCHEQEHGPVSCAQPPLKGNVEMSREIVSKDDLIRLLNEELAHYESAENCQFTSVGWNETDSDGCNWNTNMGFNCSGVDYEVCKDAREAVERKLSGVYNIPMMTLGAPPKSP